MKAGVYLNENPLIINANVSYLKKEYEWLIIIKQVKTHLF